jgi:hypothetical protein
MRCSVSRASRSTASGVRASSDMAYSAASKLETTASQRSSNDMKGWRLARRARINSSGIGAPPASRA